MPTASQKYPGSHITRKENAGRLISPSSKSIIISDHTKQGAIEARIEGEKKYFDPYISKEKNKKE